MYYSSGNVDELYILIYWIRSQEVKECAFFKTLDWDSAKNKKVFIGYIIVMS